MTPTQRKAMQDALGTLEAIVEEMTLGERYTNAGQYVLDSIPALRKALKEDNEVSFDKAEPAPEPVAHLWQHGETGRTRVVMPDSVTDCDASWQLIGPLYLALAAPVRVPAPVQEPADIDQIGAGRYKVVPAHESVFHRWAVVAGDGTQQLYLGREIECQNMARKFAGAFLDGAYLATRQAQQPAPVPLLTDDEIAEAGRLNVEGERMLPYSYARAIEQAVRQKAGL